MKGNRSQYYSQFDPRSIGDCQLWLDAADRSTMTLSGSNVTQWNDKSGNGRNAVNQYTAATLVSNVLNANSVLRLTGSTNYDITYPSFPNTAYTIFTIQYLSSDNGSYARLLQNDNNPAGSNPGLFIGTNGTSIATFTGPGSGWNDIDANSPARSNLLQWRIVTTWVSGSTLIPYVDGTAQTTKVGTTRAFSNLNIGSYPSNPPIQAWQGDVAEIIVYSSALTTTQRQQIEGYIAQKWGLKANLPATHPFKSVPPSLRPVIPTDISGCQLWLDAADPLTIVSYGNATFNQYLTTSAQTIPYTGTITSVSNIISGTCTMNGAWISPAPRDGNFAPSATAGQWYAFIIDGIYCKVVKVQFTLTGTTLTGQAISAGYNSTNFISVSISGATNDSYYSGYTSAPIATSSSTSGYGVASLLMSLTSGGSNISVWSDKSGGGFNLTSGGTAPTYSSSSNAVVFNGTGYLVNTTFSLPLSNRSVFIVANQTSASVSTAFEGILVLTNSNVIDYASSNALIYTGRGSQPALSLNVSFGAFANYIASVNSGDYRLDYLTNTTPTPYGLYVDVFSNPSGTLFVNGSSNTSDTVASTVGTSTGVILGARVANGNGTYSAFLNGSIYEIIVYNRSLNATQRQLIEGYLTRKWRLDSNLPATHLYRSLPALTTAFSPVSLPSSCALWLDAADATTLTLSGSNITAWNDKSGNGNSMTAYGTPTYINTTRSVYLNGSSYFQRTPFSFTQYTMFIVAVQQSGNGPLYTNTITTPKTGFFPNFFGDIFLASSDSTWLTTTSVFTNGTTYLFEIQYDSLGNISLWKNGETTKTLSGTVSGTLTIDSLILGKRFSDNQNLTGSFFEVIQFNATLTTPQRQQVEGYLAHKWGLTGNLPVGHPYKLVKP